MTIRDVEYATGLTRANIRFYEEKGLIDPQRQANGYREYDQIHVDILLRVKLLRSLDMPIETIRQLKTGDEDLLAALDKQIQILSQEQQRLETAGRVCQEMRRDNVAFATLDAPRYLRSMELPHQTPQSAKDSLTRDVPPRIFAPWRRYWARLLDSFVYTMLLSMADTYWFGGDMPSIAMTFLGIGLMLLLEPVLLHFFGTTLGKWIFGIRVADLDGNKLFFSQCFRRTWGALMFGQAFDIPLLSLWRLWKSYQAYDEGVELPWEDESELIFRDLKVLRYFAAIATAAAVFAMTFLLSLPAYQPPNRGDLTVTEFAENYRHFTEKYGLEGEYELTDSGEWFQSPFDGTAYLYLGGNAQPLDFEFTTENGILTCISFAEEIRGDVEESLGLGTHQIQQLLTAMAFAAAQEDFSFLRSDDGVLIETINSHSLDGYCVTVAGILVECRVEYRGYYDADTFLIRDEAYEGEPYFRVEFILKKVG